VLIFCKKGARISVSTGWMTGVRFPAEIRDFSLFHIIQTGSGAHPPSYPMGTRGLFPRVKQPRHEADHSSPSSAKVKNNMTLPLSLTILYGVYKLISFHWHWRRSGWKLHCSVMIWHGMIRIWDNICCSLQTDRSFRFLDRSHPSHNEQGGLIRAEA
jgi:hypothetical protein